MTPTDRIERAARALAADCAEPFDELSPKLREGFKDDARHILTAAFPELLSTPPTHWLAPWNLDREQAYILDTLSWGEFRDAYLKDQANDGP